MRANSVVNATMRAFGYPDTLVADYRHWCVLLRPAQATLGALVLVCRDDATAFSAISDSAFTELHQVTAAIERALMAFQQYDKINYLMLMMVDPDVHFHVLPRYGAARHFGGQDYSDPGWPKAPELSHAITPNAATKAELVAAIKAVWT